MLMWSLSSSEIVVIEYNTAKIEYYQSKAICISSSDSIRSHDHLTNDTRNGHPGVQMSNPAMSMEIHGSALCEFFTRTMMP